MTCDICDRASPADAEDELCIGMNHLIRAVAALGFDRARDAIHEYADDGDPDQADWHPAFIDMVHTAVGVAAEATGEGGYDRWLAFGDKPGVSIRWGWKDGSADAEFAGIVLRSVVKLLGREDHTPMAHDALRLALPLLRATAADLIDCMTINGDPATIAPIEWEEIAPDLDAIVAAEACVPRPDDDLALLNEVLDAKRWRDITEPGA